MQSPVITGTVVAGFRVESLIGEGAMGSVYLAEDLTRGGRVALKVLAPELAPSGSARRRPRQPPATPGPPPPPSSPWAPAASDGARPLAPPAAKHAPPPRSGTCA